MCHCQIRKSNPDIWKTKKQGGFTMKVFICKVCGHLVFNELLGKCPVCGAEPKDFEQKDHVFQESQAKSPEAEVKHVPSVVVNKSCGLIPEMACTDVLVRVGKTLHPMEEKHLIQFVDCYLNDRFVARAHFTPGVHPAACFHLKETTGNVTITEHCNLHGYWKVDCEL